MISIVDSSSIPGIDKKNQKHFGIDKTCSPPSNNVHSRIQKPSPSFLDLAPLQNALKIGVSTSKFKSQA